MIKIDTKGPSGPEYDKWRGRAEKRRGKDIDKWIKGGKQTPGPSPNIDDWAKIRPTTNQKLWSEFKAIFLSKLFNDKCAYCEGDYSSGYPAQVEHFRPKAGVTDGRNMIDHPGYFWLAYEWENLILACGHCNSWHPSNKDGKEINHEGKLNEFRIRGPRVTEPSDDQSKWQQELKAEQPLLLNPYFEDPNIHIVFNENGTLDGITDEGKETIEVCDLNRIKLIEARCKAKENVSTRIINRIPEIKKDKTKAAEPFFESSEPFSAWLNFYAKCLLESLISPYAKAPAAAPGDAKP